MTQAVTSDGLPPDAPRGRAAERIYYGEALSELRHYMQTSTEFAARVSGQIVNNVLDVQTRVFDASGMIALEYGAAIGCIDLDASLAPHQVTVATGGGSGVVPAQGAGVYIVAAGVKRAVNIGAHQVTLYGTAGDTVSFQVYTRAAGPSAALGAVDGGAP